MIRACAVWARELLIWVMRRARVEIDRMLAGCGAVQAASAVNLAASRGVAVREFVMKKPNGRADYLLFVDGRAAGVIEAKKEGGPLIGVGTEDGGCLGSSRGRPTYPCFAGAGRAFRDRGSCRDAPPTARRQAVRPPFGGTGAGAWFGNCPSTSRRNLPAQAGHTPVIRTTRSRSLLIATGEHPVPTQLPAGTPDDTKRSVTRPFWSHYRKRLRRSQ